MNNQPKYIFSFDAETNGLWGEAFAIGAVVYQDKTLIDQYFAMLPHSVVNNKWVIENVLPVLEHEKHTHESLEKMLTDFAQFYHKYKENSVFLAHIPMPVETNLFKQLHQKRLISDFEAPFPLIDLGSMLHLAGENPISTNDYIEKYQLNAKGKNAMHHPLQDAEETYLVYQHLTQKTT